MSLLGEQSRASGPRSNQRPSPPTPRAASPAPPRGTKTDVAVPERGADLVGPRRGREAGGEVPAPAPQAAARAHDLLVPLPYVSGLVGRKIVKSWNIVGSRSAGWSGA